MSEEKASEYTDDVQSLAKDFSKAEKVINDIESGQFSTNDLQGRIEEAIKVLEDITRAVSSLSLFSSNEQVEDIPTASLPYLLLPCYLGTARHNKSTGDAVERRDQLELAKAYYKDFLRRLRNYGFQFEGSTAVFDDDDLSDTPQPSVKKFTGEDIRERKIARFRRQKQLKQIMEELRRQQQMNKDDESSLRELHLTVLKFWIEKVVEELHSIEEELPLVDMMAKRQRDLNDRPEQPVTMAPKHDKAEPGLKPFILTRTEKQKEVFGLGYPAIPSMTVDEWYNQKFGNNAASSMNSQKPGCSDGQAGDTGEKEHAEEDDDESRARMMRWDEYKDDHRRGWGNTHNKGSLKMAYRTNKQDSDTSDKEDDDDLPLKPDLPEKEDGEPAEKKKAANIWADSLLEQGLLQRGSRIALEKNKDLCVPRGVETYQVPSTFTRVEQEDFDASAEPEPTPAASDDPFGDAPVDLPETAFCERLDDKSVPRSRNGFGHRGGFRGRGGGPRGQFRGGHRGSLRGRGGSAVNNLKRSWTGKPVESPVGLLLDSYSLETLMATEFASDISIEELGDEMARAMGERDPRTVKSIVQACGMEKALALFEETRNVESHGGMMIENGQRRRTPGGVFITLFKLDSEISEDVKKRLFGETKAEARKMLKARKKGRINYAENVAKVAELIKKDKEKHKDEDTSLKPLPEAEQVLLAGDQPGDTHVFDDGDMSMEA